MLIKKVILISVVVTFFASSALYAGEGCDPGFTQRYQEALRLADSLRPDKGGQMRVIAADGSEFTAGQARWMQGQLRLVDQACVHGDQAAAARLLNAVQQLLKTHHESS